MENINAYLTNTNEKTKNFMHDDIKPYILEYKRMNLFNMRIKRPKQKIWLKTPKLKMSGNIYNNKKQSSLLSLILYDQDEDIIEFKEFIENIESFVTSIIHEKYDKNLTLKSCIKYEFPFSSITIQLPFVNKNSNIRYSFDTYDINNNKISCDEINSESFVIAYIELSDVWINSNEYGINLKVLQMKIYPEFDFKKCVFEVTNDSVVFFTYFFS